MKYPHPYKQIFNNVFSTRSPMEAFGSVSAWERMALCSGFLKKRFSICIQIHKKAEKMYIRSFRLRPLSGIKDFRLAFMI